MTAGGLPYDRCQKWMRHEAMAEWVLAKVNAGSGDLCFSTWTLRDPRTPRGSVNPLTYTRIGVAAVRASADLLARELTTPVGSGSAFVAVEGWTSGAGRLDGDQPRHHLHSLSRADAAAHARVREWWEKERGYVMVRRIDSETEVARYCVKDAVKDGGYFAVGGVAWLR